MTASALISQRMQAWCCIGYGGTEHLRLQELPTPKVGAHDLLIQVHATTIASADVRIRTLTLPRGLGWLGRLVFGFRRPRQPVLGTDLAGVVVAVGAQVKGFQVGERVVAMPGASMGCHAQYRAVPETKAIARIPDNLSYEIAVALAFGGTTALHFLRQSALKKGEALLVIGASGAVGSAMVQLGRYFGAGVTGVTSTGNVELVRSLGAADVIDYTQEPSLYTTDTSYDVIADTVAASSFAQCLGILKENGRYLSIAGGLPDMLARRRGSRRTISGVAAERADDLATLLQLAAEGHMQGVIDQLVDWQHLPTGHARAETGRKRGNVVVRVHQG